MRRIIGWIALLIIAVVVAVLMAVWGSRDDGVLMFTTDIGNLVIGILVAVIVGWFIAPLLNKGEET